VASPGGAAAAEPSIKGSVVRVTVEELRDLVRVGTLREDAVRAALGPEAAELALDRTVSVSAWIPVRLYDAILRHLIRTVGRGHMEYMVEGGRRTARALAEQGMYAQLERRSDGRADPTVVRLIVTLSKAIYNFTRWELGSFADGAFEIVISEAGDYPDTLMWRNVGFVEVATSQATGEPWSVGCERPTRDCIRLVVTRHRRGAAA
jgi:hypothetical protein